MLETLATQRIEDFLKGLAQSREAALLLDYDATLAPFHVDRHREFPHSGVPALLQEIMNTGHTRVVIITGRPAREIAPLLGLVPYPEIWGAHGLQRLQPDGTCEMPKLNENVVQALAEAAQWVEELGLSDLVEVKAASVAVHWGGLKESSATRVRGKVMLGWLPIAHRANMTLQAFDGGVEIQMSVFDKETAVQEFLRNVNPGIPVAYLGDDQPVEEALRVLHRRALRILVRPQWRETAADVWLRTPEDLVNFLFQWLAVCWRTMQPPVEYARAL